MKTIAVGLLMLLLAGFVNASTFTIGGKNLEIPEPSDFHIVTPEMDGVYRLIQQMADPMNDQLACYISKSDVAAALAGETPALERYYLLKVNKNLKEVIVGSKDFGEIKRGTKLQNKEIFETIATEMSGTIEEIGKGIRDEFDVDFALKLSQMVPLEPHYEGDHALAYSMYINYGTTIEGSQEDFIVSATATYVNVAGKVLFLYTYGPKDDLEWTRTASESWMANVMASNAQPPISSQNRPGMDWGEVLEKGIGGAISGGLIALVLVGVSRFKRSKKANKTNAADG